VWVEDKTALWERSRMKWGLSEVRFCLCTLGPEWQSQLARLASERLTRPVLKSHHTTLLITLFVYLLYIYLFIAVLGMELRLSLLSGLSTTELHPQALINHFISEQTGDQ
jgi:hypothetical protein